MVSHFITVFSDVFVDDVNVDIVDIVDTRIVDMTAHYRDTFWDHALDRILIANPYEGALRESLLALKSVRDDRRERVFAEQFQALYTYGGYDPSWIIVVPTTPILRRLSRLGRSPIGDIIGKSGVGTVAAGVFRPSFFRRKQAPLSREKRLENMRDGFRIRPDSIQSLRGKNILIADDVISSGATAHAMARSLRDAGAWRVEGVFLLSWSHPDSTSKHE